MIKITTTFLFVALSYFAAISQTYTFTNTTAATINSTATTTRNIVVSGVPTTGMVLRQVNISFGDLTSIYSGDMAGFTLKLTDPSGNVINLLSPTSMTTSGNSNSANKAFNIHMRDHAGLKTPAQQATATGSTTGKGYPFNYGYYKPEGNFSSFNTTSAVNGTWIFSMSAYSTSYGRQFNSVELIFGDPIQVTDIRATAPNQSCATKQCMQTGDILWAKNTGYPNGQANTPLTTGGCSWNSQQNNSSWFYFTASATTAKLSASGFSTPQETGVFKSSDCSNFTMVAGGCAPTELFSSSPSMEKYYNGSYASGYSFNQGYQLSGLVVGETYIFIIDGQSGTQSEFYVEMVSGADNGCCTPPTLNTSSTQSSCSSATGTATVAATGGTPPFTYLWSNGQTAATATGLAPGSYSVTVSSSPTCSILANVTVTSVNSPTVTTAITTAASCGSSNGSVSATVTGGTSPYTYSWSNGATTQNLTGVAAGTYTLTVTDANTCTGTNGTGIVMTSANGPTVTTAITTAASCGSSNGEITTTVTGGTSPYTYLWSNGATTQNLTGVAAGTYTLTVTDANTCTGTNGTGIVMTSANGPTVTTAITTAASCGSSNGEITTTVTGGTSPYTYLWSNGATTQNLTGVAAGTYTLTVTDANTCTGTNGTGIVMTSANGPTVTTAITTAASCGSSNGEITTTVTGGTAPYTYLWSNGATTQNLTGVAAGTYTLTVTDANTCTGTNGTGIMMTSANGPTVNTAITTAASCGSSNGEITTTVTGGTAPYTYLWSNGATTQNLTGVAAGTYTLTVTDANTCTGTNGTGIVMTSANGPTVTTAITTAASCGSSNGSISATVTGGTAPYTYSWSNGATTQNLTGVAAGTYTLTITDANTCTGTNGTGIVMTSANGPTVTTAITTASSCGSSNGSISATVTGGTAPYTYSWSNGATTQNLTGVAAGTYTLTVTDANTCTATNGTGIVMSSPNAPVVNITSVNSTCNNANGSATANATGGSGNYTYLWTPGGQTTASISNLTTGNYSVTVTDNLGCTTVQNITISSSGGILIQASSVNAICGTSLGSLSAVATGGNGNYTYTWQPGNLNGATQTNVPMGTYTLTVTDGSGCSAASVQNVAMNGSLNVQVSPTSMVIDAGQSANLFANYSPQIPGATYTWTPPTGLSCTDCPNPIATPSVTTNYEVTVTAPDGCSGKANSEVKIKIVCGDFFVPTIFSPNGDGKNDYFQIYGNCIVAMQLKIYDRWGELVFESDDQNFSWDGTLKGELMNPASFVYALSITTLDGNIESMKGNVSLVR